MRPLGTTVFTALLLCAVAAVQAQDTAPAISALPPNSRLIPNPNLAYKDPNLKGFGVTKTYSGSSYFQLKPFAFLKAFQAKAYTANGYNTSKYWAGNFKFKTTDANIKTNGPLSSLIRMFKTKTAQTQTATVAGKTFATRTDALVAEKNANPVHGKIQNKINKEGPNAVSNYDPLSSDDGSVDTVTVGSDPHPIDYYGSLHPMTIDDVRALLGKTK